MKKTKRFSLGLLSSLLLAVGFVRAADRLDPMTNEILLSNDGSFSQVSVMPCLPCNFAEL